MKKISIKLPDKEYFCHPKLRTCFSKAILEKLQNLKEWDSEYDTIRGKIYGKLENFIKKEDLEKLYDFQAIKNNSILLMDCNTSKGCDIFFKKYKLKKVCAVCKNKINEIIDKNHILTKSFFKRKRMKLGKFFRDFEDHVSNTIFLCKNCHGLLHSKKLKKLKKLIKNRKQLNKILIKDMNKEIQNYKLNIKILENFYKKFTLQTKKDFNKMLFKLKN